MKIEQSTTLKIMVTDVPRLDPIAIYLEDQGPGKGKIIITCFNDSWTAYWGGTGNRTISEFVSSCNNAYLIGNLSAGIYFEIDDLDKLVESAKREVILMRRGRSDTANTLSSSEARDLFEDLDGFQMSGEELYANTELMSKVFGDEWWYSIPKKANPQYEYLSRILDAVKEALNMHKEMHVQELAV